MPPIEPKTETSARGGASHPLTAPASAETKRTLTDNVTDMLNFICDRFGQPTEFEHLIAEFKTLVPPEAKG